VNSLWKGRRLVTPVGGGVQIQAKLAIDSANLLPDERGEVAAARDGVDTKTLADGQWWWD